MALSIQFSVDSSSDGTGLYDDPNSVLIKSTNWDDFGFKTLFEVTFITASLEVIRLGMVKIGHTNLVKGWTLEKLPKRFTSLPDDFFSLGQDVDYYKEIHDRLDSDQRNLLLQSLRDVVFDDKALRLAKPTKVFYNSLSRGVSMSVINGQFRRVLAGEVMLDEFKFIYQEEPTDLKAGFELDFHVIPGSKPPSNIHVLIGRNGVGKTTILNNMVKELLSYSNESVGKFYDAQHLNYRDSLAEDYFSSVVSVSFSAFDPFQPPPNAVLERGYSDNPLGLKYSYIGMKKNYDYEESSYSIHKSDDELMDDLINGLKMCFIQPEKMARWAKAIHILSQDKGFGSLQLTEFNDARHILNDTNAYIGEMSSGHKIVLLTITKLVASVEEKTLVLMDEPESHLHPPLLSAFMRALSELLINRNGLAIIATHSPVVIQEVPSSCVHILSRTGASGNSSRPDVETFGENVGVLTREVFKLDIEKSGFHSLLQESVDLGGTFDEIMEDYDSQLGIEAQGILRVMISFRDSNHNKEK